MSTVSGGRRRAFRSRHHTPMGEGGKLAVIFVCSALILFVFAVMLGNHLRGLAEEIIGETTEAATTEAEVYYANAPSNVIGRGILFGVDYNAGEESAVETEADASSETVADTSPLEDPIKYDSLSVVFREKDAESGEMILAYSSHISMEYRIDTLGATDLDIGMSLIEENWGQRTSVCGIFAVDYLNRPDETREIMRAYEQALICELIEAGVDEIMLLGFANDTDEGIAFISDIYERKGRECAVGLALAFDYVNSPDARSKLGELSKKCGFLALDLYSLDVPALMSAEALITDRVSRTSAVCREFSIRVLVGCGDAPDCEAQSRAAIDAGAKNLMTGLGVPRTLSENTENTN